MTDLNNIVQKLKEEFPIYSFYVLKGLFGKYIAVEIHKKIPFTIWIDKNTGHKILLDEVNLKKANWLKTRIKSKIFHWSKTKRLNILRQDYHNIIFEKLQISLPERRLIRNRLELSLQKMHVV